jgi:predicted ATP-dependent protease
MPDKVLKELEILAVAHMDEVLPEALVLKKGQKLFKIPKAKKEEISLKKPVPIEGPTVTQ